MREIDDTNEKWRGRYRLPLLSYIKLARFMSNWFRILHPTDNSIGMELWHNAVDVEHNECIHKYKKFQPAFIGFDIG